MATKTEVVGPREKNRRGADCSRCCCILVLIVACSSLKGKSHLRLYLVASAK